MDQYLEIKYKSLDFEELSAPQQEVVRRSAEACKDSYAPYSNFHVGACGETVKGDYFTGSNCENAAFGAGICAERALIYSSECRTETLKRIAISGCKDGEYVDVSPCGVCRQSLLEVEEQQGSNIEIIFKDKDRYVVVESVTMLLPFTFNKF